MIGIFLFGSSVTAQVLLSSKRKVFEYSSDTIVSRQGHHILTPAASQESIEDFNIIPEGHLLHQPVSTDKREVDNRDSTSTIVQVLAADVMVDQQVPLWSHNESELEEDLGEETWKDKHTEQNSSELALEEDPAEDEEQDEDSGDGTWIERFASPDHPLRPTLQTKEYLSFL